MSWLCWESCCCCRFAGCCPGRSAGWTGSSSSPPPEPLPPLWCSPSSLNHQQPVHFIQFHSVRLDYTVTTIKTQHLLFLVLTTPSPDSSSLSSSSSRKRESIRKRSSVPKRDCSSINWTTYKQNQRQVPSQCLSTNFGPPSRLEFVSVPQRTTINK